MMISQKLRRSTAAVLAALFMLALIPAFSVTAHAVTEEEIQELQDERDRLAAEAEEQQQVIDNLTENKALVIERKLALDKKIELLQQEIDLISAQISLYDDMIAQKETELEAARKVETEQTELLRVRMRAMEENSNFSYLSFIFEATSLTDLLGRISDINDIMHYDKNLEQQYIEAREDVAAAKQSYEETQAEQEALSKELETRKEQLNAQVDAACALIANIETESEDAQAEYEALAAAEAETDSKITELIAQRQAEIAAQQAAAAAAAAASSGSSSSSSSDSSSSDSSSSGSSGSSYGTGTSVVALTDLMWPVPSCYLITSPFGSRTSPTAGASSYHGGLDIGASENASILAAASGTVILAEYYGGYGNCVMIDHGNGIVTLYGHMNSIATYYGATVSQGEVIGYVGSTGVSTGPHCHYEIRVNGTQVDPAPYYSGLTYYY